MRKYIYAIWSQLRGLVAAIRGKAPAPATATTVSDQSVHSASNVDIAKVHAMLPTKSDIDCVRAYFRLIGIILRYERWIKPGEPLSAELQRALQLFPAVEWQYAECGFRPVLPFNRLYEMSEEPEVVVTAGFVVRRVEGEKPVYFARAVVRRMERRAAPVSAAGVV
jgi:hypothetical protein